MLHALKTIPNYFKSLENEDKNFEIRKFDRPFRVGDEIVLQEWTKETQYTGKEIRRKVSYVFQNEPSMGLKPGFCILGLKTFDAE